MHDTKEARRESAKTTDNHVQGSVPEVAQFKHDLAGMSYSEQIEAIRPRLPLQVNSPDLPAVQHQSNRGGRAADVQKTARVVQQSAVQFEGVDKPRFPIPASVTSTAPHGEDPDIMSIAVVDRGESQGVTTGMFVVLVEKGLVGKITMVMRDEAWATFDLPESVIKDAKTAKIYKTKPKLTPKLKFPITSTYTTLRRAGGKATISITAGKKHGIRPGLWVQLKQKDYCVGKITEVFATRSEAVVAPSGYAGYGRIRILDKEPDAPKPAPPTPIESIVIKDSTIAPGPLSRHSLSFKIDVDDGENVFSIDDLSLDEAEAALLDKAFKRYLKDNVNDPLQEDIDGTERQFLDEDQKKIRRLAAEHLRAELDRWIAQQKAEREEHREKHGRIRKGHSGQPKPRRAGKEEH